MPQLLLDAVTFRYRRGAPPALQDFSLQLGPGVVGLVGPNGAGKSSLLRLITGSVQPEQGRITIDGEVPGAFRARNGIGFIPEQIAFPSYLTVGEFLAGLQTVSARAHPQSGAAADGLFGLDRLLSTRLNQLSLGQKRRVELAAALVGEPPLLLLDEPTNGLDPLAVASLRAFVVQSRRSDRLILVSSHHLDELQRMVDRVVLVDQGWLLGVWTAAEIEGAGSVHELFHELVPNREY